MKQVLLDLQSGKISVEEVPIPLPRKGVVVENQYSLIPAGTESSLISLAEKSRLVNNYKLNCLYKELIISNN